MKTYVLYQNPHHNYSDLENVEFIFKQEDLHGKIELEKIKDKLAEILDECDLDLDRIVMNGPSYLTAIAGYIWLSRMDRNKYNMMAFNPITGRFALHDETFTV